MYRLNEQTTQCLEHSTAPTGEEPTSRCQTSRRCELLRNIIEVSNLQVGSYIYNPSNIYDDYWYKILRAFHYIIFSKAKTVRTWVHNIYLLMVNPPFFALYKMGRKKCECMNFWSAHTCASRSILFPLQAVFLMESTNLVSNFIKKYRCKATLYVVICVP